jgi:hypothetical protein
MSHFAVLNYSHLDDDILREAFFADSKSEQVRNNVLGDILSELDLHSDAVVRRAPTAESISTDHCYSIDDSVVIEEQMDPILQPFINSLADEEDLLTTSIQVPDSSTTTAYLGGLTPTWSGLDLDSIPITMDDLNLPDMIEPFEEVDPITKKGEEYKDISCHMQEDEDVFQYNDDEGDSDYSPSSERSPVEKRCLAIPRRKVDRPRGSSSAESTKVRKGRIAKRTRIVQSRLENLEKGTRLYEAQPFGDPQQERCRRNAINAKLNRDRKMKEKDALAKQMNMLRRENQRLQDEAAAVEERASSAEAELDRLRAVLRENGLDCKAAETGGHKNFLDRMDCGVCSKGNNA